MMTIASDAGAQNGLAPYIPAMAHNNGMVPRSKKTRASPKDRGGKSDNAAKFQAAVDAVARMLEADPAIDPAYQTVPISEFVPHHRPARPPKSEGGKTFKLVSEYTPAGDQPNAMPSWWPGSMQ